MKQAKVEMYCHTVDPVADDFLVGLDCVVRMPLRVQVYGTPGTTGNNADTIQVDVTDNGNTGTGGGGTINLGIVNVDISEMETLTFQEGANGYTGTQDTEFDQQLPSTDKGSNVEIRLDSISGNFQQEEFPGRFRS